MGNVKITVKVESPHIHSATREINPIEIALLRRGFSGPSFDWPIEVAMCDFRFSDHPVITFPQTVRDFLKKYYSKSTWKESTDKSAPRYANAWTVLQPFSFEVEVDGEWYERKKAECQSWPGAERAIAEQPPLFE